MLNERADRWVGPQLSVVGATIAGYVAATVYFRGFLSMFAADVAWFSISLVQLVVFSFEGIVLASISVLAHFMMGRVARSRGIGFWICYAGWILVASYLYYSTVTVIQYRVGGHLVVSSVVFYVVLFLAYALMPLFPLILDRLLRISCVQSVMDRVSSVVGRGAVGPDRESRDRIAFTVATVLSIIVMFCFMIHLLGQARAVRLLSSTTAKYVLGSGQKFPLFVDGAGSELWLEDTAGELVAIFSRGESKTRLPVGGVIRATIASAEKDIEAIRKRMIDVSESLASSDERHVRSVLLLGKLKLLFHFRRHNQLPDDLTMENMLGRDLWGNQNLYEMSSSGIDSLRVISRGPDGLANTPDDLRE